VPDADAIAALAGRRVLAFAGIGDPQKFFATLAEAGIAVAAARSFPDHHRYTGNEARALCDEAERAGFELVTTEKDLARLTGGASTAQLAKRAQALPVTLAIDQAESFKTLLLARIGRRRTGDV
jgi:tetraacyldisaccharide 4'-kinase